MKNMQEVHTEQVDSLRDENTSLTLQKISIVQELVTDFRDQKTLLRKEPLFKKYHSPDFVDASLYPVIVAQMSCDMLKGPGVTDGYDRKHNFSFARVRNLFF